MAELEHERVANGIRDRIVSGAYSTEFPSERGIEAEFGVSRTTVRAALATLKAEGLLTSKRGKGYSVRSRVPIRWLASEPERNVNTAVTPADAWSRNVRTQGHEPSERITVETIAADAYLAERLNLDVGALVVARRRLRFVDGEPFMTADSFYDYQVVKDTPIMSPADIPTGAHDTFAAMGRPWAPEKVDRVRARMPTRSEIQLLAIQPGTPVLYVARLSVDQDKVPVRLTVFVVPGDRSESEYRFTENEE